MKRIGLLSAILLALVIAMSSCYKEGYVGPQGPQGIQGPQGPQGPAGQDGYVNVASSTLTVHPNDWYWDETSWRVDIDYANITQQVTDYGAVFVYMDNNNTWRQLPMTFYYSVNNDQGDPVYYSSSLEVSSYDNGVSIFWTENDFFDGYRPEEHKFKIVVLEATVYATYRDKMDFDNYEEVKRVFKLEE